MRIICKSPISETRWYPLRKAEARPQEFQGWGKSSAGRGLGPGEGGEAEALSRTLWDDKVQKGFGNRA